LGVSPLFGNFWDLSPKHKLSFAFSLNHIINIYDFFVELFDVCP